MTFDDYQREAKTTAVYPKEKGVEYCALGLASEVGEVCGKIKKVIRDKGGVFSPSDVYDISKEIGDNIWYLAMLCNEFDLDFGYVAKENLLKLHKRMEENKIQGSGDNR